MPVECIDTDTDLLCLNIEAVSVGMVRPTDIVRSKSTSLTVFYESSIVSIHLPSRHSALAIIGRDARLALISASTILDRPYKLPTASFPKKPLAKPMRIKGKDVVLKKYGGTLTAIVSPGNAFFIRLNDTSPYWCGAVQGTEHV